MNINLTFDSSTNGAPAAFFSAMNAAAQYFDSIFLNPITVNITVGYGSIDGQSLISGALGESETEFNQYSYSQIRGALIASAATGASTLPAADPTSGGNYWVATAEAKAIGLSGPSGAVDGFVGFASPAQNVSFTYNTTNGGSVAPGTYDFFGVAAHELSEVLGRDLFVGNQDNQGIGPNSYTPLDLFHYSSGGTRDFQGTTPGYFSVDSGATDLDSFNTNSNGDFGDWANSAGNDAFRAFSNSGVANPVSQADLTEMSALGYSENTPATVPGNNGFAGNFAGNGYADIVWQNTVSGTATIWTNSAGTIPSGSVSFATPASWRVVGVGDFNGDGKSDIMWQSTDGTPGIWEMNGSTPIAEAAFPAPAGWSVMGIGDFAGSGRSGIVWQSGTSIGVWLMNGTTPTAETAFTGPGANWNVVGTADLTNNGRDDILLQNSTTGNLTIDFMNGTSVTSSSTINMGDPSWHLVATGRENGQAALIWQNTSGQAGIWLMNGATPTAEAGLLNAGTGWQIIGTGDFNNDGNSDLLFYNAGLNQSAIWLMNGTQIKAEEQPQAGMGSAASSVTPVTPLSAGPVLSGADLYYPAAAEASSAPSTGTGSLGQQQLATPTTTGAGILHGTQA
ncbi:MAG: VCBS repeat-containing protein [Bradyrhizobiaceae bacterium]|nr:VCBS repeat-containing protein [Bradyrhizobiaceae bacterium]